MAIQKSVDNNNKRILACRIMAWSLSLIVSVVAIIAWGGNNNWRLFPISTYQFFPVLGLLAFSIMWSHYVAATVRDLAGIQKEALSSYFRRTGYLVLVLICLHPGLLTYQRFRDGAGLPPGSYASYVGHSLGWVTLLGEVSLLVFLAFEFHRVFGKRPWWHYVHNASDAAMLAIAYHGLRLGSQLHRGWLRYVWLFYVAVLIFILVRKYAKLISESKPAAN